MKCDLCDGEYQEKTVARNYKWCGKTIVIEDVPVLVCNRCGDTLVREETVTLLSPCRRFERHPSAEAGSGPGRGFYERIIVEERSSPPRICASLPLPNESSYYGEHQIDYIAMSRRSKA